MDIFILTRLMLPAAATAPSALKACGGHTWLHPVIPKVCSHRHRLVGIVVTSLFIGEKKLAELPV